MFPRKHKWTYLWSQNEERFSKPTEKKKNLLNYNLYESKIPKIEAKREDILTMSIIIRNMMGRDE